MTEEPRPLAHLRALQNDYPLIWDQVADFRSRKGGDLGDWPDWCYLPLAAAHAIASQGGRLDPRHGAEVGRIGALAAWRATKKLYKEESKTAREYTAAAFDMAIEDQQAERLGLMTEPYA